MRLPKRINEAAKKRQEFIDAQRMKLEKTIIKQQSVFLNEILSSIFAELDIDSAGNIRDTIRNYRLLSQFDKVFNSFNQLSSSVIGSDIINTTFGLVDLGRGYFAVALQNNMPARFDKVVTATANKMDLRIGLQGGKIVRGGFLESLFKNTTMANQVKDYISKSITGQISSKEFVRGLTNLINGDEGQGAMEKQYQAYTYDLYQQYDAAYNASLADEFDMNYFVYQGGLIDDSRDFCAAHNGKVWHRSEAEDWTTWTPSQGEYPEGYEIKSKNIYEVPSYIGYPGYQPLIDRGGYRCRHTLAWISDDLAIRLRPELEKVTK